MLLTIASPVAARQADPPGSATPLPMPQFQSQVDVVGITPIHGSGLPRLKVPANVQVFTADHVSPFHLDVTSFLSERAASVHVSETQGGTFQPDLLFRGFAGSPLLGASEGLAVYQDGVRVNEAFGDTMNWDALPPAAIASVNLMPGSNPLFGLNALGGALSIRTKDGFAFTGGRASVSSGSFARHQVQGEYGQHAESLGFFVATSLIDENGWRDYSPSTVRRLFSDLAWRGTASTLNLSLTAAANDTIGNGAAPIGLLAVDRAAVFTHPDRTDNDMALLTLKGQRRLSAESAVDAVAYYRASRIGTFNGDAADDDDEFSGINNMSRTRARAAGLTGQVTRTTPLLGSENHLIAGAGIDTASSAFDFAAEWATLTADRGTIGTGVFDDDAFVDLRSRTTTASAFVANTWSPSDRTSISAAARFNHTSVSLRDQIGTALNGDHRFGRLNPSLGITYQLHTNVNVYGSYAQSSRVPTPVELTCADPEDPCRLPNAFVSDPPLDQIVARTWETGARGTAAGVTWSVAGFTAAAADDIIFVSSGTLRGEGHFENVERTRRTGMEAAIDMTVPDRFTAFAAYTLQRATFGADLRLASPFHPFAELTEIQVPAGSRLPGVPTHSGKFGVTVFATSGLAVAVNARVQSSQPLRGDEANLLAPLPGFAVVNAQARQRLTRRLTAVLSVHNLFDARHHTFGVLGDAELLGEEFEDEPRFYSPGAPRGAWAGIEVRF
jgi:outer membrane receptor protein involved in Fe transport